MSCYISFLTSDVYIYSHFKEIKSQFTNLVLCNADTGISLSVSLFSFQTMIQRDDAKFEQ